MLTGYYALLVRIENITDFGVFALILTGCEGCGTTDESVRRSPSHGGEAGGRQAITGYVAR